MPSEPSAEAAPDLDDAAMDPTPLTDDAAPGTAPDSPTRPAMASAAGEGDGNAPSAQGNATGLHPGVPGAGYGYPAGYGGQGQYPMHPYQMAGFNPAAYQYYGGRPPYPYASYQGGGGGGAPEGANGAGFFPSQQQRAKQSSPGRSSRGGHATAASSSSPRRNAAGVAGGTKGKGKSASQPEVVKVEAEEIEKLRAAAETELTQMDVKPIQTDFHFFVSEKKGELRKAAEKEVRATMAKKGKLDVFLVNSNLNCRLMKAWEDLSVTDREEYVAKEQGDRRRFMQDDEVASRHCATLTARVRSPDKKDPNDDVKRSADADTKTESPTKKNKTATEV